MNANFRFAGGREMAAFLAKLPERTSKTVQRNALRAAAEPMREDMTRLAPFEPGKPDLRDTMSISPARGPDLALLYKTEVAIRVGPSRAGFYGIFQEFGTIFQRAQPFMRPAFDQNVQKALEILRTVMWAAISKARGGVTGIRTGPGRTL